MDILRRKVQLPVWSINGLLDQLSTNVFGELLHARLLSAFRTRQELLRIVVYVDWLAISVLSQVTKINLLNSSKRNNTKLDSLNYN